MTFGRIGIRVDRALKGDKVYNSLAFMLGVIWDRCKLKDVKASHFRSSENPCSFQCIRSVSQASDIPKD